MAGRTRAGPREGASSPLYYGVPLLGEDGRVFGSVCHFDLEPRAMSPDNLELLEAVSRLLNELFADSFAIAASGTSRR